MEFRESTVKEKVENLDHANSRYFFTSRGV